MSYHYSPKRQYYILSAISNIYFIECIYPISIITKPLFKFYCNSNHISTFFCHLMTLLKWCSRFYTTYTNAVRSTHLQTAFPFSYYLFYHPYHSISKPFHFNTTICTVDFEIPKCFAA